MTNIQDSDAMVEAFTKTLVNLIDYADIVDYVSHARGSMFFIGSAGKVFKITVSEAE